MIRTRIQQHALPYPLSVYVYITLNTENTILYQCERSGVTFVGTPSSPGRASTGGPGAGYGRVAAVPLIQISQTPGLTPEQKRAVIAAVTSAYAEAAGKNPDKVWVTITEVPGENWGVGGVPLS
nr:4-oxalocrotonate tautomerase family protein [Rhodococcus sp. 105337]